MENYVIFVIAWLLFVEACIGCIVLIAQLPSTHY
jgi:hypothetical protein